MRFDFVVVVVRERGLLSPALPLNYYNNQSCYEARAGSWEHTGSWKWVAGTQLLVLWTVYPRLPSSRKPEAVRARN